MDLHKELMEAVISSFLEWIRMLKARIEDWVVLKAKREIMDTQAWVITGSQKAQIMTLKALKVWKYKKKNSITNST